MLIPFSPIELVCILFTSTSKWSFLIGIWFYFQTFRLLDFLHLKRKTKKQKNLMLNTRQTCKATTNFLICLYKNPDSIHSQRQSHHSHILIGAETSKQLSRWWLNHWSSWLLWLSAAAWPLCMVRDFSYSKHLSNKTIRCHLHIVIFMNFQAGQHKVPLGCSMFIMFILKGYLTKIHNFIFL